MSYNIKTHKNIMLVLQRIVYSTQRTTRVESRIFGEEHGRIAEYSIKVFGPINTRMKISTKINFSYNKQISVMKQKTFLNFPE